MKVLSIIVTYNGKKWIDKCIGSQLLATTPLEVLVIDNGSTDGTPEIIRQKYPQVEVLETGKNLGFGKANNIGLKKALEERFDYAFLLNQDAWIEKDTLENLIKNHQKEKEYGILCPVQLNGEGSSIDLMFNKYTLSVTRDLIRDSLLDKKVKNIYPVAFANAACWLLPKETLENVGGFDPVFEHYGEDDDYVNRVKNKAYHIGLCPHEKVYHDREYRSDVKTDKQQINDLFKNHLINLKSTELPTPAKEYYYKKKMMAALMSKFAPNKNFYKTDFLALKKILTVYKIAVEHKNSEKIKHYHYLDA